MALNKIDPTKIFKTCSLMDPSIDIEATGKEQMKQFEESYDMKYLKFKAGDFPTIFHIQNILSSDEAKIKQDHMKIEFPELDNKTEEEMKSINISEVKPKFKQVNSQEMLVKYFNSAISMAEENNQTFPCSADMFPYTVVQELGSLVMMRTQLGDDLKNAFKS